jgi:RNA polymerase sigma-70 factor (ECF subfamily)
VDENEKQWIDGALLGNPAACGALYDANARWVSVYFLRCGFARADADDLVQETFVRVFRSLETFDSARGSLRPWLAAIARNAARRRWSARPRPENFDPELAEQMLTAPDDGPAAEAGRREEIDAVRQCVRTLPEDLQRVVRLRYVEGQTTRGIAAGIRIAEATVRLRIEEARRRIEKCLRGKGVVQ